MAIPGLPGGLIIYQGHLFTLNGHLRPCRHRGHVAFGSRTGVLQRAAGAPASEGPEPAAALFPGSGMPRSQTGELLECSDCLVRILWRA